MSDHPRTERGKNGGMDDEARLWNLERDLDDIERRFIQVAGELRDKMASLNRIGVSILTSLLVATILLVIQIATGR